MVREIISLGRRRQDGFVMWDFKKYRGTAKVNVEWLDADHLEEIPMKITGRQVGVVLVHRDWAKMYVVNFREGWTDDEYFQLAREILGRRECGRSEI